MSKNNSFLGIHNILDILSRAGVRVHFCGVGGVGMYPLFRLTEKFGITVSGSDRERGAYVNKLLSEHKDIFIGERKTLPAGTSLVVYSLAVDDDNAEIRYAEQRSIPTVSRAELLGALMCCYQNKIGVSGTHGKSTVTAMLSEIFSGMGLLPTVLCGANMHSGGPFLDGTLDHLIYEACEYKDSFHKFSPDVALFLNMELDHTDWFKSEAALKASFLFAINKAKLAIINIDDKGLLSLLPGVTAKHITVGTTDAADYKYTVISNEPRRLKFSLYKHGRHMTDISLRLIGEFNISNAAMAAVAAIESCVPVSAVSEALSSFSGIERRLELRGEFMGRRVYYDYAHHPTEIRESILAVRAESPDGVTVVFSPHTYSRTRSLFDGFAGALSLADTVIITEISGMRERDDGSVNSAMLADAVGAIVATRAEKIGELLPKTKGAVIIMGAAPNEHILAHILAS